MADHRAQGKRTRPSTLSAERLAEQLEQQLRTLAIKSLDGIVVQSSMVQSSAAPMTTQMSSTSAASSRQLASQESSLLPLSVTLLSQQLPTAQYWQAGRHERLQARQSVATTTDDNRVISAQDCQQGKQWQAPNGQLRLLALTGWNEIDDASIWDCSLAIVSQSPITVVHYNASNPQQPIKASVQMLANDKALSDLSGTAGNNRISNNAISRNTVSNNTELNDAVLNSTVLNSTETEDTALSRLILDVATHKRSWQLWSLLCAAEPLAFNMSQADFSATTWLSHSRSAVTAPILIAQQTKQVLTYDEQPLEVALVIEASN